MTGRQTRFQPLFSVKMKMFAYANGRWAAGGKEPWLETLASFMRPLGGGRGWEPRGVCARACGHGGVAVARESQAKELEDKDGVETAEEGGEGVGPRHEARKQQV